MTPCEQREAGRIMSANQQLATIRVLCLVGDAYEDLELWYPKLRIEEASGHVTLAGQQQGHEYAGKHGYPCVSDAAIGDMEADDFHGILIPGGWMPDSLRRDPKVLQLVRDFANHGKLVAAIATVAGFQYLLVSTVEYE